MTSEHRKRPQERTKKGGWAFVGFVVLAAIVGISALIKNADPTKKQNTTNDVNNADTPAKPGRNANTESKNSQPEEFSEDDKNILELFGFWLPDLAIDPPNYTQTVSGTTTTYDFGNGNALSVMPEESLGLVRGSLGSVTEEEIDIDNHKASRITGTSPKDGSRVRYIIIKNADQSFFLRGDQDFLTKAEKQMKIQNVTPAE